MITLVFFKTRSGMVGAWMVNGWCVDNPLTPYYIYSKISLISTITRRVLVTAVLTFARLSRCFIFRLKLFFVSPKNNFNLFSL